MADRADRARRATASEMNLPTNERHFEFHAQSCLLSANLSISLESRPFSRTASFDRRICTNLPVRQVRGYDVKTNDRHVADRRDQRFRGRITRLVLILIRWAHCAHGPLNFHRGISHSRGRGRLPVIIIENGSNLNFVVRYFTVSAASCVRASHKLLLIQ